MSKEALKHYAGVRPPPQENLFDFSEIILNDHFGQRGDKTIECVEGTGGSGTSEITQTLFNIMTSNKNSNVIQNSKEKESIGSLRMVDQSIAL